MFITLKSRSRKVHIEYWYFILTTSLIHNIYHESLYHESLYHESLYHESLFDSTWNRFIKCLMNFISFIMIVCLLACIATRLIFNIKINCVSLIKKFISDQLSSIIITNVSTTSWIVIIVVLWNRISIFISITISRTRRWKDILKIRRSILFWYLLIFRKVIAKVINVTYAITYFLSFIYVYCQREHSS
jgi:magnesium-transporting ATPase (P-type)